MNLGPMTEDMLLFTVSKYPTLKGILYSIISGATIVCYRIIPGQLKMFIIFHNFTGFIERKDE